MFKPHQFLGRMLPKFRQFSKGCQTIRDVKSLEDIHIHVIIYGACTYFPFSNASFEERARTVVSWLDLPTSEKF